MYRALTAALVSVAVGSVMCADYASVCNGAVGPFTVPHQPEFVVTSGTVLSLFTPDPNCTCQDGLRLRLVVMMTPSANACPANWVRGPSTPGEDREVLWLQALVAGAGAYTGVYTSSYQAAFNDVSPNSDPIYFGFGNPGDSATIASAVFDANAQLKSVQYASGTIVLASVIVDEEVSGSFDALFSDGSHIAGSFTVPFCTTKCGCDQSRLACEPLALDGGGVLETSTPDDAAE